MDDVAGQPAEAKRKFPAEIKKSTQNDEESTENEDDAAEFAKWVHSGILPQAAGKSSAQCLLFNTYTMLLHINVILSVLVKSNTSVHRYLSRAAPTLRL